eukprot:1158797-Pelagomonas_calceolata.AAC.1
MKPSEPMPCSPVTHKVRSGCNSGAPAAKVNASPDAFWGMWEQDLFRGTGAKDLRDQGYMAVA